MAHTVVGTAGHIDHGKTQLVKALTGIDTDRAPEEKARGITIDLGFAFMGDDIAIIDVPGHERFVKTMVAGVSAIDVALMVIAADDGIMPQSREHLDILNLLGVNRGIIALNKVDLVEEEWLELVEDELGEFTRGTFLEQAPVVRVSAQTGEGVDALRARLLAHASDTHIRRADAPFRLSLDRAFSVKGFGLVGTGTVVAGAVQEGALVDILPSGHSARVRTIQRHGQKVRQAATGDRAAINLVGIELDQVERGDVLATAGLFERTSMIDVRLELLASSPAPLAQRTRVRLHVGTAEVLARVILLDCDQLDPGERGLAQLRLEKPLCVAWGDRFVLRRYSPALSIGGGTVLDPHPHKHRRADGATCKQLCSLESTDVRAVLEALLRRDEDRLCAQRQLAATCALSISEVGAILADLHGSGHVLLSGPSGDQTTLHADVVSVWSDRIASSLADFHAEYPLRDGLRREELRQRSARYAQSELFDWVLGQMEAAGHVEIRGSVVCLTGHSIEFSEEENALRQRVEERVRTRDWTALQDSVGLARSLGISPSALDPVLGALQRLGVVINLEGGMLLHVDIVAEARETLCAHLEKNAGVTVSAYRALMDCNRKCAMALLVHFDREGLTERRGDLRVLSGQRP